MSNAISSVTQAQQLIEQAPAVSQKTPESKTPQTSKASTDTVQVSTAAQAILKEVQETHAQTIQEAAHGDNQAKRLLAKEAAATYQPQK